MWARLFILVKQKLYDPYSDNLGIGNIKAIACSRITCFSDETNAKKNQKIPEYQSGIYTLQVICLTINPLSRIFEVCNGILIYNINTIAYFVHLEDKLSKLIFLFQTLRTEKCLDQSI